MRVELLPVILWSGAIVLSLVICVGSIRQSGSFVRLFGRRSHLKGHVVVAGRWMIWCHMVSLMLAASAYLVLSMGMDPEDDGGLGFSSVWVRFYERVDVPSAVVIILAIAAQWLFLYLRARAAALSEMDARLNRVVDGAHTKGLL